jgi:opacity protein-like surface antigen
MMASFSLDRGLRLVLTAAAVMATQASRATDLFGLYVGGAVGQSELRTALDFYPSIPSGTLDRNATGWKAMAGIRPLPVIGAEIEYIDFGSIAGSLNRAATLNFGGFSESATMHSRAAALFGVGYLPLPLPYLDVFAKLGVAELKSRVSANGAATCPLGTPPCLVIRIAPYANSSSDTRVAYGTGVQVKIARFAARLEYERISASGGDPDLASFGLTWRF